jgi:hypothetical protein
VHVAQSHFHDIVPAHDLGIRSIWINRLGERAEPAPTRELGLYQRIDGARATSALLSKNSSRRIAESICRLNIWALGYGHAGDGARPDLCRVAVDLA